MVHELISTFMRLKFDNEVLMGFVDVRFAVVDMVVAAVVAAVVVVEVAVLVVAI